MTSALRLLKLQLFAWAVLLCGCQTLPEVPANSTTNLGLRWQAAGPPMGPASTLPTWVMLSWHGALGIGFAHITASLPSQQRRLWIDRPGLGWNRDTRSDLPADVVLERLREALHASGQRGPFVLVGHSLGGAFALRWAQRWPQDVAGLGLISPTHPGLWDGLPTDEQERIARWSRASAWLPWLARSGLLALWNPGNALSQGLPDAERQAAQAFSRLPAHLQAMADEALLIDPAGRLLAPLKARRPPPGLPVAWVLETEPARDGYDRARRALAQQLGVVPAFINGADHLSLLTNAQHAKAVADALWQRLAFLSPTPHNVP